MNIDNFVVYSQQGEWMGSYSSKLGLDKAKEMAEKCADLCNGGIYENTQYGKLVYGNPILLEEHPRVNPLDDSFWGNGF